MSVVKQTDMAQYTRFSMVEGYIESLAGNSVRRQTHTQATNSFGLFWCRENRIISHVLILWRGFAYLARTFQTSSDRADISLIC